ncbi:MAG: hypothetical protein ACJ73E_10085 [Mycobacteriales bacterium]
MRLRRSLAALALLATGIGAAGCRSGAQAEEEPARAATVEAVAGTELSRVTLTEEGIRRLGIRTAPVARVAGTGPVRTTIPFSAVLYDPDGQAWAYTNVGENAFVRAALVVHRVDGDTAFLSEGPAAGTAVVTVGVPELYGAEYEVGGE